MEGHFDVGNRFFEPMGLEQQQTIGIVSVAGVEVLGGESKMPFRLRKPSFPE